MPPPVFNMKAPSPRRVSQTVKELPHYVKKIPDKVRDLANKRNRKEKAYLSKRVSFKLMALNIYCIVKEWIKLKDPPAIIEKVACWGLSLGVPFTRGYNQLRMYGQKAIPYSYTMKNQTLALTFPKDFSS